MGTPVFQHDSSLSTGVNTISIGWGTHLKHDVAILTVTSKGGYAPLTTPAGWTAMAGSPQLFGPDNSSGGWYTQFWRRAESAAEPNVSIPPLGTSTTTTSTIAVLSVYRGCLVSGSPIGGYAIQAATVNTGLIGVIPSVALAPHVAANGHLLVVTSTGEDDRATNTVAIDGVTGFVERQDSLSATGYDTSVSLTEGTLPEAVDGAVVELPAGSITYSGAMYHAVAVFELLGNTTIAPATTASVAPRVFEPQTEFTAAALTASVANDVQRVYPLSTASAASTASALNPQHVTHLTAPPTSTAASFGITRTPGPVTATEIDVANRIGPATVFHVIDALSLTEVMAPPVWGVFAAGESLSIGITTTQNAISKPVLSSDLGLTGSLAAAWPLALADTASLSFSLITARGLAVAEALGLTPTIDPRAQYGVSTAEAVGFSAELLRFLSGVLTDGLTVSPVAAADRCASGALSDTLSMTATTATTAVLRVVTSEGLELTDAQLLQALFSGTLTEEVVLSLGTVNDAGDFTAWALNTVTGGVTQYENFEFNSYAAHGGQYLAASESGLYTLDGDTDAGTDIVGTLRSGYTQFAGTKLSVLDAAYVGVRGDGCYVFRIHTGTGEQHEYAAYAESMRTARVTLGRGLRTRYIAFELVSTGQDFDLDSVELTPLDLTRRV